MLSPAKSAWAGRSKLGLFASILAVCLISASACAQDPLGGSTLGAGLDKLAANVQSIVDRSAAGGQIPEIAAGGQIAVAIAQAKVTYGDDLRRSYGRLDPAQRQIVDSLVSLVGELERKTYKDAAELQGRALALSQSLPLVPGLPRIVSYSASFAPQQPSPESILVSLTGNFTQPAKSNLEPQLIVNGTNFKSLTQGSGLVVFSIPFRVLPANQDRIVTTTLTIRIPYATTGGLCLRNCSAAAEFRLPFAILPLPATVAKSAAAPTPAAPKTQAASTTQPSKSNRQTDVVQTSEGELRLMPIYHGSVMMQIGGKVIHVDPWSRADYTGIPQADLIVVTHTHADHLDRTMIDKLRKTTTIIVGPPAVIDTLNCAPGCGQVETVGDSEKKTVMGIEFDGVPMYNLVRGPAPGMPFHHKGVGSGYVLNFGNTRVYLSGDTECTPEMQTLKDISVAFLAMNPPRTETPLEAAACAATFKPKIVYPYHYRGSKPQDFADALKGSGIEVRLRNLEGEP